ncbi:MAG: glycosyltransferase [Chloroflexi bacterium]|nr:glycosyltransferase [Chloroflexota bacterium]MCY4247564.1 glycosyltransferase [Chloroflexota bacterium]
MHILQLTPYYAPAYAFGGVVRAVEGLAGALAARGHRITILTTDALDQRRRYAGLLDETHGGIRIVRCRNASVWLRGRLNLSTPRDLRRAAKAILPDVDVLHLHELRTAENLLVTPLAEAVNAPIALSPHGTLSLGTGRTRLKAGWDRLLSGRLLARIGHIIALTDAEQSEAERLWADLGAPRQPLTSVIPNGVNLHEFASLPAATDFRARFGLGKAPTILYMGRLQARKGVDVLLRAFLAANVADSRLLIAGPDEGMLRTLRNMAARDERIVFAGYLDGSRRLEALGAADILALPAVGEGQPIAVLEALAASLPVVLSPGCNMNEVAEAGAGFVTEATAPAFAEKLRLLLQDEQARRQMGAAARRLARERYSWARAAAAVERVYAEMLESSR